MECGSRRARGAIDTYGTHPPSQEVQVGESKHADQEAPQLGPELDGEHAKDKDGDSHNIGNDHVNIVLGVCLVLARHVGHKSQKYL